MRRRPISSTPPLSFPDFFFFPFLTGVEDVCGVASTASGMASHSVSSGPSNTERWLRQVWNEVLHTSSSLSSSSSITTRSWSISTTSLVGNASTSDSPLAF
eukprot:CAMPEP_0183312052 /NCGR_PEP_ID=MMETSP0160_2-20130417/40020_1 /TAXON_ID=2839 ORGANISM="Odontella Sinensis, Strain Grunow 1884" /NCGR_SAMPLE_ID=MMETSP0160_2 /ASSEMBLY_ACC=CAM_ASM_000250 /LENGTH=100 /DNA_ID=CAMNT_0025476827 /DNA_START=30 /DNA_END=329 /DNA_ORIENTATION=+